MKFLTIIAILLSFSCTRTVFDKAQKDNFKTTANLSKTAIFALVNDQTTYKPWENEVSEALRNEGIKAEAGYKYISKPRSKVNPVSAAKLLRKKGFDSVIVIELVDIKRDSLSASSENPEIQEAETMGHFTTHFSRAGSANAGTKNKTQKSIVILETTLYSLKGKFPVIWSAKSNTFNPYDEASTRKSYSAVLAKKLKNSDHFN